MRNREDDAYTCPSFNCYSSDRLAYIVAEVADDSPENEDDNAGEEFEFDLVCEDREVLASELFLDGGGIGPNFPVFNRDLLLNSDDGLSSKGENPQPEQSIMIPLGKLFLGDESERGGPPSCSSSEADELECIPSGTYCVWRPKAVETPSPIRCKKSNSTGSASKRWKFRDLLRRSNSDGKESFVFLTPTHRVDKIIEKSSEAPNKGKGKAGGSTSGATPGSPSAHEALYVRNRAIQQWEKKKSYLPYRQDLVGFFTHVNGLGKSFPRF